MTKPKRDRKSSADIKCAEAWRMFNQGSGREAIAALFTEFNMYHREQTNDPYAILRAAGQRDVLLRIVQLIGLRPEHFVEQAWKDTDAVDYLMRQ